MTYRHVTITEHFGEGICIYEAVYESPEAYTGDDLKKIAGPFEHWAEAEAEAEILACGDEIYTL